MNANQAKQLHLKELLSRLGREAKREDKGEFWYLSPFREESDASFKITRDGKGWFDHGAGQGGNILDFVIRYYNLPENGIREALSKLDGIWGYSGNQMELYASVRPPEALSEPVRGEQDAVSSIQIKKMGSIRRQALIDYLARRGIQAELAQPYLQQMDYVYGEKRYFALAFTNDSGGYELRNAHFKGCYQTKDISTLRVADSHTVIVFEGFMDFLSAIAYTGRAPRQHVIVLNSGSMRERALAMIRDLNAKQVHLWLDQDVAGRELTNAFMESLPECEVSDASGLYAGYKDMNDYWVATGQQAAA